MLPPGRRGARLGPPFGDPGEPRLDELEAFEEAQHVRQRPDMQLRRRLPVNALGRLSLSRRVVLQGPVGDGQVAARRHVVAVIGDDLVWFRLVCDEVQGARAQHRHRLGQVEQAEDDRIPQDAGRVTQIAGHHADLVAGREQRPAVRADHGIVVDIDHPRVRRHPLGQLMHVSLGRQAAAEVQKLPDTPLDGQVTHHPAKKRPIITRYRCDVGNRLDQPFGCLAVSGEIVLAAEQVIVDPGDIRPRCINATRSRVLRSHIA